MRILGKSVYEKCPTQSRIRWTGTVEHPPRCRQITQINQRRRQARGFLLVFSASKGRRSAIERAHAPIASSSKQFAPLARPLLQGSADVQIKISWRGLQDARPCSDTALVSDSQRPRAAPESSASSLLLVLTTMRSREDQAQSHIRRRPSERAFDPLKGTTSGLSFATHIFQRPFLTSLDVATRHSDLESDHPSQSHACQVPSFFLQET